MKNHQENLMHSKMYISDPEVMINFYMSAGQMDSFRKSHQFTAFLKDIPLIPPGFSIRESTQKYITSGRSLE